MTEFHPTLSLCPQQVLMDMGVATTGFSRRSSSRASLQECSPPSHAIDKHRNSTTGSPDSCSHPSDSSSKKSNSKLMSKIETLTKELAEVKTHRAEAATLLEQKKMDLKQALQGEALVLRELQSAKQYIASLEQRVREA